MKVLFVGVFTRGYLELFYERAFIAQGCKVLRFDLGGVHRIFQPMWERLLNKKIFKATEDFRPDLIFVMKGHYLWSETVRRLSEAGKSLIFCFMGDNPLNLAWPSSTNRNILESIPYYDCYFIWTKTLIEPLLKSGARRARYLPFGFDTACHRPLGLSDAEKKIYGTDIVFVGNWDNKREQWLEELSDFNLSIWGPWYWWKCCRERRLLKKWKHRVVFAEDLARALSGAKISINILREQNKDNYNMRTFEAPACGAFVLAERSDEARDFFKEDAEAIYFSNPGELREKASYYLAHEDARREIANSGYKRCQEGNHSYFERAKQIIDAYGEIRQSK